MKTRSIFFSLLVGASAFTFINCGGSKKEESHDVHQHDTTDESAPASTGTAEAAEPQFNVDASFQQQLAGVFGAYVTLKEALVSSDAAKVSSEA